MINIVFCGRNDKHGGTSFRDKVTSILKWNTRVFRKYNLDHIFWFVEWGKEPGMDWLSPELTRQFESCRCIMVPDEIVNDAQEYPVRFQEFTAKNIAIVRATEGLVIATNSDILFPEVLVMQLKELVPDSNTFYRAPRHDFILNRVLPNDEADFVWSNRYDVGDKYCEAAGDFLGCTPQVWEKIKGYSESPGHVRHLDSEAVIRAQVLRLEPVIFAPVYHKEHPESTKFENEWKPEWGIRDIGLANATKIMPRNSVWGHRHCKLTVVKDRLMFLQKDSWEPAADPKALNHRGETLYQNGDISGALNAFAKAIETNPGFAVAYNNLGVLQWNVGEFDEAIRYFKKSLELEPDDRDTILNCIKIMIGFNKVSNAEEIYSNYLKRNPDDEEISRLLSETKERIGS
ncbi:MAG: tetratricopeptide repeat protein [Desulfobacteria bacterium]